MGDGKIMNHESKVKIEISKGMLLIFLILLDKRINFIFKNIERNCAIF